MSIMIDPEIHAHLTGLSDAEITQAADRWKAFERIAGRLINQVGLEHFSPSQIATLVRSLDAPQDWSGMFESSAVSKITELADLVRAKSLEDAFEWSDQIF